MHATRQTAALADENNHRGGRGVRKPALTVETAATRKQQQQNKSSHNATRAVQAGNRRVLGDIANIVGAMSVRCNVNKDSVQGKVLAKQIALNGNRPITRRCGAALLNSQNAAFEEPTTKKTACSMGLFVKVVEVRAEEAKLEVMKAEVKGKDVAGWGANQRHSVTSSQLHDIAVSAAAMQPQQTLGASKAISASNKPGKASSAAHVKVNDPVAPVKQKEQTLPALLTARSKAVHGGIDAEMQEQEVPDFNIDRHDVGNELAVVDYIEDIHTFYRKTEVQSCVPADYMAQQSDINEKMRAILVDWLIEVHLKFKLIKETLYLTINLIDRYLSVQSVSSKNLQLVGVTALLLAAKYEEIWAPEIHEFVNISDNAYTREQILNTEKTMLNTLQFNLTVPTPYVFVSRCLKAAAADQEEIAVATELEQLSWYLVELCLTEYSMVKYCPSHLAAAAVYTAQKTLAREPSWGPALQQHSGYIECQLKECAMMMTAFQRKAGTGSLTVVHKKYSSILSVAKLTPSTSIQIVAASS